MKNYFKSIKLSIVTPILDSHAIVRRQILHYKKMNLPNDIEIIFIDDNSNPPLRPRFEDRGLKNLHIYPTGDKRPWSIACARNLGIRIAMGEYIFNNDIDHILPKEAIIKGYNFIDDKMEFNREIAILDNKGNIHQEAKCLFKYGMSRKRYKENGVKIYYHVGTHVIKKKIVEEIGGYPPRCCNYGSHPTREDRLFYHRYKRYCEAGHCKPSIRVDKVYCFPNSNWKNWFHNLKR